MSAPQRLPYAVVVATRTKGGTDLDINTFEYLNLQAARDWFHTCCSDPATISVTLEGPDSIQLADYSDNITTAHIFPSSEEPKA